jgi:hypothetical protein
MSPPTRERVGRRKAESDDRPDVRETGEAMSEEEGAAAQGGVARGGRSAAVRPAGTARARRRVAMPAFEPQPRGGGAPALHLRDAQNVTSASPVIRS